MNQTTKMKLQEKLDYIRNGPVFLQTDHWLRIFMRDNIDIIQEILNDKSKHWKEFCIPKRNGKLRKITAPSKTLLRIQRSILENLLYPGISASDIAHGFVKNKSPKTNAEVHIKSKIVVGVDMKDFFPSISVLDTSKLLYTILSNRSSHRRAYDKFGFLSVKGLNNGKSDDFKKEVLIFADVIAELLTYKKVLPQGAPTSPAITNIFCRYMDEELKALEKTYGCRITRYADDITVSSDYNTTLANIIPEIKSIIGGHGFRLNQSKTHINKLGGRFTVTGVVVNEKVNIQKTKRRNMRAKLHNLVISKGEITKQEYSELQGQIAWMTYLNPLHGDRLMAELKKIPATKTEKSDTHASV